MKLYLDVCCLNRPFDPQDQARVRDESAAVKNILASSVEKISSLMVRYEIAKASLPSRVDALRRLNSFATIEAPFDKAVKTRASELRALGFRPKDSVHIASAEAAGADFFLTTDDRLLRRARRNPGSAKVQIENPAAWWLRFQQP